MRFDSIGSSNDREFKHRLWGAEDVKRKPLVPCFGLFLPITIATCTWLAIIDMSESINAKMKQKDNFRLPSMACKRVHVSY